MQPQEKKLGSDLLWMVWFELELGDREIESDLKRGKSLVSV